ncbi:MAG: type II toxin-antitoxin system RelE/ParE family toxin [Oscillospiraceae bacterium]|nr:type II toxin-antitoxin system RelE/ParE family toxin [Oscillospiraceae bacterium]
MAINNFKEIKYTVNISLAANNDLDEIFSYIANTLYAEQSAAKLMREIQDMILSLNEMPERFSLSLDSALASRGYRRATVKKYVILYTIDKKNKIVNVMRVFHGSMDYSKYI